MTRYKYVEKAIVPGSDPDDLPGGYREKDIVSGSEGVVIPDDAEFVDIDYGSGAMDDFARIRYLEPVSE